MSSYMPDLPPDAPFALGRVLCDVDDNGCVEWHEAAFSHMSHTQGPIYAAVCPVDDLTGFYTLEVVEPLPESKPLDLSRRKADQ